MFYSQFILAKKGPLGTIWIAAHLERKLRRNQVAETDIGVTVDNILFPEVPIALRLSGHLLLGVVRIYSRQVNYLFNDCSETLGKIKQAFHSAAVDLPPEATTAPFHSITLPETFDFDELELAQDSEGLFLHSNGKYVDHHVTTREQITLQDSVDQNPYLGSSQFGLDERFGDGSYSSLGLDFDEEFWGNKAGPSATATTSTSLLKEDTIAPSAGDINEVTHMDVDEPYKQPLESERQKGKLIAEAVDTEGSQIQRDNQLNTSIGEAVNTEIGQIERDNQLNTSIGEAVNTEVNELNTSIPAISLVPSNEPAGLETMSRNDSNFAVLKHDTPGCHAYTPRVLEACTPDLNQEYCPPDEPSTPALAEETSLPMYKDCNAESAGRSLPVILRNIETSSSSELLPASQQVSCAIPSATSVQATRSPSAAFQGFPLQQATPAEMTREASFTQKENDQAPSARENVAPVSTAFQSYPLPTFMQQTRTSVCPEGAVFPTGTSSVPSLPLLRQQDANLSVTVNHQSAGSSNREVPSSFQQQDLAVSPQNQQDGSSNQEVHPPFQQQGLAVSPQLPFSGSVAESSVSQLPSTIQNIGFATIQQGLAVSPQIPVVPFGSMTGSSVSQPPSTMQNIIQQGLALSPQNPVSSFGSMAESLVSQPASTMRNTVLASIQQGLAVSSQNLVSPFGSMVESRVSQPPTGTMQNSVQQGLAVSPENPVVSFGSMTGSSFSQPPSTMQNIIQQGLAVSPQNPVSSFGSMAESLVSQPQSTMRNMGFATIQQGLAVSPQNSVSSFGSMVESHVSQLPTGTVPNSVQQGLPVGPQNPVSSFGSMTGSSVSQSPSTMQNIIQQRVAVSPQNPVSSFGSMAESLVSQPPCTMRNMGTIQQGLAVSPQNPASSFGSMVESHVSRPPTSTVLNSVQQSFPSAQNPVSSTRSMAESFVSQPPSTMQNSAQQGLPVSLQNPVSSFGSMAGSLVSQPPSTPQNMGFATIQQGPVVSQQNPVSSSGSMAESLVSRPPSAPQNMGFATIQQGPVVSQQNPVSSSGSMAESLVSRPPSAPQNMGFATMQQGLAVRSQSPASSFGSMADSPVSHPPNTMRNMGFATIQQGVAVSPQNSVSAYGPMAEAFISQPPSTMRNFGASQVLASPFVPQSSVTPLFSTSSTSLLPVANVPQLGHMEKMDLDKEAARETLKSAAPKGPLWQSAAPQANLPSSFAVPAILSSMNMGDREILRSAYDSQRGSSDFPLLQKDMSVERISGLESGRNKPFSAGTDGIVKEALVPAFDKTPILREETPYTFTRAPFLSTHSLNSVPADDDVLASILGGRSKAFKVVSTPRAPNEPKLNLAKRPKRAPRVTPKKRKIDLDTVAVLHGDVIRQQLANAEDIRRDRRKAPCTRREVWGFIRECEGQENFDEPTLPELSPDLHDLYHDVLHGPESRSLSAALNGAVKAKLASESIPIRTNESDYLADGVNNGTKEHETRGDRDILVDCVNKDSSRDACTDEFVGSGGNISSENFSQLSKEVTKLETTQSMPCRDSKETENVRLNAQEISQPEAYSGGLAGKEEVTNSLPVFQVPENYMPSSIIARETEANKQVEQIIGLGREVEGTGQAQKDILSSSLSENVVGVVGAEIGYEGIAMQVQDVVGIVGADVGHEGIAVQVQDVVGVVGADVGDEGIAMAVQKDAVVGADVGDEGIAMAMQKDAVVGADVVGVVGADVGDEGIAMAMQKDAVVGADVGNEGIAMAVQKDVVVCADVVIQERAMAMQQDTETSEEKQQLNFGTSELDALEGEVIVLNKEADFKASDIPSDQKDTTEVLISDEKYSSEVLIVQAVDIDKANVEVSNKVPTSYVTEEETNLCKDDEEMVAMEGEKDTDSLDEDNDIAYAEIDYSSDEQDASIQDDNGWSARSRNVGRYLKTVFGEMEGSSKRSEQGPTLGLERVLARKTKREAARMFFETLVLKTKDYIHVEQNVAYQDILLYPRSKLMKAEF